MAAGITDKTRKALWGRAAARCSLCRASLIVGGEQGILITIGEECHIVGQGQFGPRREEDFDSQKLHDYSNLLLLCRNCHKEADSDVFEYTIDRLHKIKLEHENWVSSSLHRQKQPSNYSLPFPIHLLRTGRDILNIIAGAGASCLEIEDVPSQETMVEVADFTQCIKDYIDIWGDLSETSKMDARFHLAEMMASIRKGGMEVYGAQRRKTFTSRNDRFQISVAYVIVYDTAKWVNQETQEVEMPEVLLVCEPLGVPLA